MILCPLAIYERYRRFVADRAVWSNSVVVYTPSFQFFTCVVKAHEPMRVQALTAEAAIETLNIGIVGRFSGLQLYYDLLNEVNSTVSEARKQREKREQYYKDLRINYVPRLLEGYQKLLESEVIPIAKRKKARRLTTIAFVLAVVGFIGSIASIAGFFNLTMNDITQEEPMQQLSETT